MFRMHPTGLVAIAAMALLAGCGSSSSSGPSKGEFLTGGDAICKQASGDFDEAIRSHHITGPADARALTADLLQISQDEVAKLRQLDPPADLKSDFDDYLRSREQGVELIRQANQAAGDSDPQGYFAAIAKLHQTQDERSGLAEKVGFTDCSQELTPSSGPAGG